MTSAAACLSIDLLRYVRDERPTEEEFLAWLGGPKRAGVYHTLRKAGLLMLEQGRLSLSPEHLAPDSKSFTFHDRVFWLDKDEVWYVCTCSGRLPGGQA
jgi:hypothetical protein